MTMKCNVRFASGALRRRHSYSSVPGFRSLRYQREGTFYIQFLVNTLNRCGTTEDIHTMLTKVNREMALELKYGLLMIPLDIISKRCQSFGPL
ncbi:hypothetical protein B4U80_04106 [Leptotrombidium deliense]|uniref:Caspase family p10 domain-containing protein n=1 Tax=Leptotrombidium deliense TaxID=299467 RepID=A0A443RZ24_9ACAR|nr:hypothetical protein B4U80_04106 [Leptotrombidium deliense]